MGAVLIGCPLSFYVNKNVMIPTESLKLLSEDELSVLMYIYNNYGTIEDIKLNNITWYKIDTLGPKLNDARTKIKDEYIGVLDNIWSKLTSIYAAKDAAE